MIEILKFEDTEGTLHHYNLAKVIDIKRTKEGRCIIETEDDEYDVTEAEFNRINNYNEGAPNGEAGPTTEN